MVTQGEYCCVDLKTGRGRGKTKQTSGEALDFQCRRWEVKGFQKPRETVAHTICMIPGIHISAIRLEVFTLTVACGRLCRGLRKVAVRYEDLGSRKTLRLCSREEKCRTRDA